MIHWTAVQITPASKQAHPWQSERGIADWRSWAGTVIRVWRDPEGDPTTFRNRGCDSYKFYLVHPDDARRITGSDTPRHVCEHEITLTLTRKSNEK